MMFVAVIALVAVGCAATEINAVAPEASQVGDAPSVDLGFDVSESEEEPWAGSTAGAADEPWAGSSVGAQGEPWSGSTVGDGYKRSDGNGEAEVGQTLSAEFLRFDGIVVEDGICVAFDAYFDWLFTDDYPVEVITAGASAGYATLEQVDDGAFGAIWQELQTNIDFQSSELTPEAAALYAEMDQRSQEQCGFKAATLIATGASRDCFYPIQSDGTRGLPECGPVVDPRG